ncbi:MAG: hypothetical protein JNM66_23100 [Bryobacterales bacterium]|nr:hypothetical protein [Bryobacterales bacterium]
MNNLLDENYGVADARREKRNKRIIYSLVSLVVLGGVLWFFFRNYKEEARVKEFLVLLERQDFQSAYAMWGCTHATPCRDYKMEQFLRDWGPQSDAAKAGAIQRSKVKSCDKGIIQLLQINGQDVNLYVDRSTLVIGFAPWPVCNPRVKL